MAHLTPTEFRKRQRLSPRKVPVKSQKRVRTCETSKLTSYNLHFYGFKRMDLKMIWRRADYGRTAPFHADLSMWKQHKTLTSGSTLYCRA